MSESKSGRDTAGERQDGEMVYLSAAVSEMGQVHGEGRFSEF